MVNKKIWIIGASSGIGKSLAIALKSDSNHLILSGRREDKLQMLKQESLNDSSLYQLDITRREDIETVFNRIIVEQGAIDSVVLMSAQYAPMTVDNLDMVACQNIIDTNIMATFSLLKLIAPYMKSRGRGQIVLCASVAGYCGLPNAQPYSATKAATINLAESLRLDLRPFGIDVKVICPGFVKSEMTDKNSFSMPMIISSDEAAQKIVHQLSKSHIFEIKTHGLFTVIMKCLKFMPYWLYFMVLKVR